VSGADLPPADRRRRADQNNDMLLAEEVVRVDVAEMVRSLQELDVSSLEVCRVYVQRWSMWVGCSRGSTG